MDELLIFSVVLFVLVAIVMAVFRTIRWFIRLLTGAGGGAAPTSKGTLGPLRDEVERLARQGVLDTEARNKILFSLNAEESRLVEKQLAARGMAKPVVGVSHAQQSAAVPGAAQVAQVAEGAAAAASSVLGTAEPAVPLIKDEPLPPPLSLAERAERYAASREAAAAEALAEPVAPVTAGAAVPLGKPVGPPGKPTAPRQPLSRLFSAFMEEKNIRWGELVGGLLIVGCSIALVISFWSEIAARPLLKFVLFNGVTAALFGVGLYTDRRWKLRTTSHGLLIIATLLVPLNFLAIAAFTQESPPTDLLSLAGEGMSLVVFAALVYLAGRILVPGDAWLLAVGVMLPSLMQLLVRRFAEPGVSLAWLYALAGVPVLSYLVSTILAVNGKQKLRCTAEPALPLGDVTGRRPVPLEGLEGVGRVVVRDVPLSLTLDESAAQRMLVFLGLVSAATLMPLALLAYKVPPLETTAHWLSPLVAPCGLPALLVGLLFWRGMKDRKLVGLQTAGIGVGALGALLMIGAVVLAWPDPATLLPTALLTAIVLTAVAWVFEIPAAHVPAGLAWGAAWLVGFYVARGEVGWMLESYAPMRDALVSATSGHVLVPLVGLFGSVAWWLARRGRREDGLMYGLVAAATAAVSLVLVMWFGFGRMGDPQNATWTLAIYAVAALAAATQVDRAEIAWAAALLLLATIVQGEVYRFNATWQLERPWTVALLTHASLCAVICAAVGWLPRVSMHLRRALLWSGLGVSAVAAATIAAWAGATSSGTLAVNLAWLAAVWLVLAALADWPVVYVASQIAVVLAILCAVSRAVEGRDWYAATRHPGLDPWFLEAKGIALAAYCLVVGAVRWVLGRIATSQAAKFAAWPAVERVIEGAVVLLLAVVAVYAVVPGVEQELSPLAAARGSGVAVRVETPIEQFEVAAIPHAHAADRGAWLLLGAVAVMLVAGLWQSGRELRWQGLVIAAAAACPLLATRWEGDVAVASALRWLLAGFLVIASVPILYWKRTTLRDLSVAIVVIALLVMGAYVAQAALLTAGVAARSAWLWPYLSVWALTAGVAALVIPRVATELQGKLQLTGEPRRSRALHARDVLLLLAVGPLAILLIFAVASALDQHPLVGPKPNTWFRDIGWDWSYGVPLAVMALVFVGYAVRDRSSRFAFAAGLLANVVATIALLIRLARGGGVLDAAAWCTVAQVNAIVTGVVALVWLGAVTMKGRGARSEERDEADETLAARSLLLGRQWPLLLVTQVALAAAICGMFLLPGALGVALQPARAGWVVPFHAGLGWIAVALATVAAGWINWRRGVGQSGVALFAAGVVALVALTVTRWDTGAWEAYHTLLVGCCAAAWLVPIATHVINQRALAARETAIEMRWSVLAVRLLAVVAVVLALMALDGDPSAPWWTVAALAAISARNVWIAWHEGRRGFVWVAAVLANVAVSIWWIDRMSRLAGPRIWGPGDILWVNVLAAAAMGVISVWVERTRVSPAMLSAAPGQRWLRGLAYHRFAAWAIVIVMAFTTAAGLAADLEAHPLRANWPLAWAAWGAALVAAVACWWDPATRWPVACIYCVGLLGVGLFLDGLNFATPMFQWALALALGAYSLATSALWSVRDRLRATGERWGVPLAAGVKPQADGNAWFEEGGHGWLVPANLLMGVFVLVLVWWVEITLPEFPRRMVAAYAIGAQAFAIGLLARGAVRTSLQYLALVWGVLFAIAFGWAWLAPDHAAPWLHRLIVTVAALAATVPVYGFGLVKFLRRENEWTRAAGRLVPVLALLAAGLLLVVLGMEVTAFVRGESVPIAWPALVVISVALVGLMVAALAAALLPGRDPLGLSERGRTIYVYAAEAFAALLFVHIRVTMPWLFAGWFVQFWPLVVMGIAFIGVGLGEVFQRYRQRVLSEPLQTTGALLPLLPALGFWFMSSQVHYSLLLLSVGVLYAALSVLRQSFWFGVLAAVAANGSLWYLLHTGDGLGLFTHPQLWLIPPALSALAAGYINRERLSREQSAALRYGSAIVIYVSSTADIFINGVSQAPWLPAVLAGLSIMGVLAGIWLRVRAFLYLGTAFLVVALMTIIWHAAIEQQRIWILWVVGVVTGILIIAMFGVFEKRRDDVLRVVEKLKQWEA